MRERDETVYQLVLKINEIQPDQWDEVDERDYRLIDAALRRAKAEGWPKVNAPAMYDDPDPGWVDTAVPDLARIWELSREVGYAIGLHGSLKRDMDLIAAPWTDEAIGNAGLIDHLCAGLPAVRIGGPERKSHGRIAVTLQMDGYFKPIDLSIMPRLNARAAQIENEATK